MAFPYDKHRLSFPGLEGLYGWVTVDGQPLEVYGTRIEGSRAIGYIEAQDDKEFKVHFHDEHSAEREDGEYATRLYVDGAYATGHFALKSLGAADYLGKRVSPTTRRPFMFGSLHLTDDDDLACTDEQVVKNLGTIQLGYHRLAHYRELESSYKSSEPTTAVVHEQAKKATLSHQAQYGAALTTNHRGPTKWDGDWIDEYDAPFSSLEFRYRSRALLELEGYIDEDDEDVVVEPAAPPLPPSPPPLVVSVEPQSGQKRSSHEESEDDAGVRKKVKREKEETVQSERESGEEGEAEGEEVVEG